MDKLLDNGSHPLHSDISTQRSLFSQRLLRPKSWTNRLQNPSHPSAPHWGEEEDLEYRGQLGKEGGGGTFETDLDTQRNAHLPGCNQLCHTHVQ